MKNLELSSLNFGEDVKKQLENEGYSPEKVVRNVFAVVAQKKFEKGTSLEKQRMYFKVMDKLEGDLELSDEQFDFMYEVMTTTEMPIFKALVQIVDYLEEVKLKK